MDMASFPRLPLAVQESARPAAEADASAVQDALTHGLADCGLFDQVELGQTDNPDQLVIGVCRCAPSVLPWESGYGVERLWNRESGSDWYVRFCRVESRKITVREGRVSS